MGESKGEGVVDLRDFRDMGGGLRREDGCRFRSVGGELAVLMKELLLMAVLEELCGAVRLLSGEWIVGMGVP